MIISGSEEVMRRDRGQCGSVVLTLHTSVSEDISDCHKQAGCYLRYLRMLLNILQCTRQPSIKDCLAQNSNSSKLEKRWYRLYGGGDI